MSNTSVKCFGRVFLIQITYLYPKAECSSVVDKAKTEHLWLLQSNKNRKFFQLHWKAPIFLHSLRREERKLFQPNVNKTFNNNSHYLNLPLLLQSKATLSREGSLAVWLKFCWKWIEQNIGRRRWLEGRVETQTTTKMT